MLAVTLTPVLVSLGIGHRHDEREPWVVRLAQRCYAPVLRLALRHRLPVVVLAGTSVLAAVILMRGLGAEFVPRLSEGAIVINIAHLPGTSLETTAHLNTMTERALLAEFPDEIAHIWTRTGTAEVATDPMGIEASDMFVSLSPRGRWTKAVTQADLADRIQRFIRDLPGQHIAMTQPIEMRLNEMVSGVRGDVAIKLFGDDLDVLQAKAGEITAVLYSVGGAEGITMEQVAGQPALAVSTDASALARYGIPAADVMQVVSAIGGIHLGDVTEGQLRFPLVARLPAAVRDDPARLGRIPLASASGSRVPLAAVAQVRSLEGPLTINREWGQRRIVIQCNVPHRDVAGFVAEAKAAIAQKVALPPGRYRLEWGGQFENLERARLRLAVVVPVVLVAIFLLLAWSLASLRLAALVFTGVPVAAVGGIAALWIRGMPFSISAAVGFIALAGVAVLNGLVMVTFIRQLRAEGLGREAAIVQGSLIRLRPVLMTALVAAFGFVPMALATGMGAEVQRPLATVVIGGIASSTLLTLLLIPVLYAWFEPRSLAATATGAVRPGGRFRRVLRPVPPHRGLHVRLIGASMTRILIALILAFGLGSFAFGEDEKKEAKPVRLHASEWCFKHDLPKDRDIECTPALIPKLKKDNDWCKEHNCAESICRKCDPKEAGELIDACAPIRRSGRRTGSPRLPRLTRSRRLS